MPKEYYSIKDFNFKGRNVLVMCNFDVPLKDGEIEDDEKIKNHLDTLRYLDTAGAKRVLILSYLGRPKGTIKPELSLRKVSKRLSELLDQKVVFVEAVGDKIPSSKFILLENTRFNKEEESNDEKEKDSLAKRYVALLEDPLFINDGFSNNHRNHSSVVNIQKFMPSAAGFLLDKEIKALQAFVHPDGNAVAVLGGAKLGDKIEIIEAFLEKYDHILIGGGTTFTFLKAMGYEIGTSLVNDEEISNVQKLLQKEHLKEKILFPERVVVAKVFNKEKKAKDFDKRDYRDVKAVPVHAIPFDCSGFDVLFGAKAFDIINKADYIYWNGPVGVFENPDFRDGSLQIGKFIEERQCKKIAGGGDTSSCIKTLGLKIPISTGGGAASRFIIDGTLVGIEALKKNFLSFKNI